ncbi:MAG: sensor histidine kinase [Mucilaginibacter sp.]|nr:sensor histidine kinase [Mucilaginibacter sp.]
MLYKENQEVFGNILTNYERSNETEATDKIVQLIPSRLTIKTTDKSEKSKKNILKKGDTTRKSLSATKIRKDNLLSKQDKAFINIAGLAVKKFDTLKNSSDRLQLAANKGGVGIWEFDPTTGDFVWDDTMYKLYGFTTQFTNAYFKMWINAIHPEDRERMKMEGERAFSGEQEFDSQYRVVWPDQSIHYIRAIGFVQRDAYGKALRMVGTNWDTTEIALTAQKLEKANNDLNTFFNAIDDVFFSVDMENNKVLQISNACEKLFGYKAADFLNDYFLYPNLIHPEDGNIPDDELSLLKKGKIVSNQYRIIRKDKTACWVENKMIPTLNDTGKLIRVDGIIRDITLKKNNETKLKLSEERFRRIVETAQEGIWTIDENNCTDFVNNKITDILEYASEEIIGKDFFRFINKKDRQSAVDCIKRIRNGSMENLEIRHQTKSGKSVWLSISANPILDENGGYKGALAMVTDVTHRKMNEEALKKSEASLRTIVNKTDVAYILIDDSLKTISFNKIAEELSISLDNQLLEIGKSIKKYFKTERWPFILDVIEKVKGGETVKYEEYYKCFDGSVKWHEKRWDGVTNNDNQNCGLVFSIRDITSVKLASLEREKMLSDIITRNKDLEQFTYIVSHNLRAPVANILGLTNVLTDHELEPDEITEVIKKVSASASSIDTVISDLNQIIQARRFVNERKEIIFFNGLVDSIKHSISDIIALEDVQIKCLFDAADSIFSIRNYMHSIFYNLLSNSIKYRKKGIAPVINIESHKHDDKLELRFKDNGKGMDLDNTKQIFGLYKRFDTTVEGKGMGLFMVKTQVEALGGTIEIISKAGEGAEFIIQLPY